MSKLNNSIELVGVADSFPKISEKEPWNQLSIHKNLNIPNPKPDIEQITKVVVSPEILSNRIIHTPKCKKSKFSGRKSTGKKLIVGGKLKTKVFYVADKPEQPIHSAHFDLPFSSHIILPACTKPTCELKVNSYVEDIFIKSINSRDIFIDIVLFLHVVFPKCNKY
ncbi:DUF3794 domain-containing protein [Halanaerobaculum tunisiense]